MRESARIAKLVAGLLLMVFGPAIGGPLPGPFGVVSFGLGLALVLRSSKRARRFYVRSKRRWPKAGRWADFSLQRRRRRHLPFADRRSL